MALRIDMSLKWRGICRGICNGLGIFSALIILSFPTFADPVIDYITRNDLGAAANEDGATGETAELMNIAQVSDVHIIDPENELRALNLKAFDKYELGPILDKIPSTSRLQDHLTGVILDATVHSVNKQDVLTPFDFAICTGDHTDTDLEIELRWFVDIAEGNLPSDYQERVESGVVPPIDPEGFTPPWYTVLGNHDVEYMGTFNTELIIGLLFELLQGPDTDYLLDLFESISLYETPDAMPAWHGLDLMPEGYPQEGYYSFTPVPYIHCIVLNTANYNTETGFKAETLSLGALDQRQLIWMKEEIEANDDKLVVIFSHHSAQEFHHLCGTYPNTPTYVKAEDFKNTLCAYDNVIAHVNGHTHINRIVPIMTDSGGYWDINTCAIIEYPQEWRQITIEDNGDGTGTITCTMGQHEDAESLAVALSDPDANPEERIGAQEDRNVKLLFTIPAKVAENIRNDQSNDTPDDTPDDQPDSKNPSNENTELRQASLIASYDGDAGACFIAHWQMD